MAHAVNNEADFPYSYLRIRSCSSCLPYLYRVDKLARVSREIRINNIIKKERHINSDFKQINKYIILN